MRTKQYFTIYFNDLSNEKQMEILEAIKKGFRESVTKAEMMEICGADPYDHDQPDFDRFEDILLRVDDQAQNAWCELEVVIDLAKKGKTI